MNLFFHTLIIFYCSLFSVSAMAVCGVPQDLINAASAGSTLDFTGCSAQSGTVSITKPLHIIGLTLNSPSGAAAVTVRADNVTLERVTLTGPQATSWDYYTFGISAEGSASLPVRNLTVINSVISRYPSNALNLNFVNNAQILNNQIHDSVYAGIMMLSAAGGLIQGNTIQRIGVYGAAANSNNAYGIAISQGSAGTSPVSTDVIVNANIVEDVPTWSGLDTHAGVRIQFTNNIVRRCRNGIFITGNSAGQRNLNVVVDKNRIEALANADQYGITHITSTDGQVTNNNIIGYPSGHEILTTSSGCSACTAINLYISGNYNDPSAPLPAPAPAPAPSPTGTPVISLSASSLSFANQVIGTTSPVQIVTITNKGTGPLTITSAFTMTGDFAFGGLGTCDLVSYAPGQSCTASVVFTPTASGLRTGTLSIPSNATSTPVTVALSGTGITDVPAPAPTPALSLSANSLSFGNQLVGTTSAVQIVTITSSGTAPLTFSGNFTFTGDFTFGGQGTCALGVSYAPGQTCTASVVFNPTVSGVRSGSLTIPSNATSTPVTVSLSGTGITQTALDTTAPVTGITSPTSSSYVYARSLVTIQATATDNVGVQRVDFYVNGSLVCTSSATPYQCAWRVPKRQGRTYTLQTKAVDAAGNVGSSSLVYVTSR